MVKLNRPHIGIFGRMNVGKSSLINALTGQSTAVVADVAGTTTDPVKKNMEILGIGPVTLIDTAGVDDTSALGPQRVEKTKEALEHVNLAILVFTDSFGLYEKEWTSLFRQKNIPYFLVHNKADLLSPVSAEIDGAEVVEFSAKWGDNAGLISAIIRYMPKSAYSHDDVFGGFVEEGDEVVFVMPIDDSAPEGRLILPQVQSLRGLLDRHAVGICLQPQQIHVQG